MRPQINLSRLRERERTFLAARCQFNRVTSQRLRSGPQTVPVSTIASISALE